MVKENQWQQQSTHILGVEASLKKEQKEKSEELSQEQDEEREVINEL